MADQFGADDLIVVFGLNEPDNLRIMATTCKGGDPSYAGALAGVALGLKSYHILELKDEIPEEVWNAEMGMEELELEEQVADQIRQMMPEIRGR